MTQAETAIDYGGRARIGLIVPSVNTCTEVEFPAVAPAGVRFHVTRLALNDSSPEGLLAMADNVEGAAGLLADAGVDMILFHCTAVTTFRPGYDDEIITRITAASGVKASATSKAVLGALDVLGIKKVALRTPYMPATNQREVAFLEQMGVGVTSEWGKGIEGGGGMYTVTPEEWYDLIMARRDDEADGYFLSCTAIRTASILERLENDLGRPVISSNQSAIWHCLRQLGIEDGLDGYGELLARH